MVVILKFKAEYGMVVAWEDHTEVVDIWVMEVVVYFVKVHLLKQME